MLLEQKTYCTIKIIYAILGLSFLICFNNISSFAQNKELPKFNTNLKYKRIPVKDSLLIDSLSIATGSFQIQGISADDYIIQAELSKLIWKHKPTNDSVTVEYRTLPISFFGKYHHKALNMVDSVIAFTPYSYSEADSLQAGFVQFKSIDYNGTYGRSLSIGNAQDVSLNSNFNLQMNGYILDSVRIEAALTDNNIPFQPDGNTQQLQEFDKVFITFQKGVHKLTAGDFGLTKPNSYFMNFDKRVQGLMFQTTTPNTKNIQNKIGMSGSIAKGEFARNIFQGSEGNQGPYKLTGNNGEIFFIVIAGSEKVYIDGILMERGEQNDYTIDYNTSEVTFMPRQLITKDKRIQIEFEYQSRNYLNTLFYVYDELKIGKKWNVKFNGYSNQDAKNQPYLQTLDDDQKRFLSTIGDNINDAFYKVIQLDTFTANKILYRMTDTLVAGQLYDSIFVYTSDSLQAKYRLSFSFVGNNKGNYNISGANTNGRSYSWIAPINGVLQGSYEPVVLLVTPKMQQMLTTSASYQIDSLKKISIELGASNYAPNLFSTIDNNKHWGYAGKVNYEELRYLGKKDTLGKQNLSWSNVVSYEYTQAQFKAIAPFRNVEFARDFNINDSISQNEQYLSFESILKKRNWGSLQYDFNYLQQGPFFNANRNILNFLYAHKTVKGGAIFNVMNSNSLSQKSIYYRPSAFLEKTFPKIMDLTLGTKYQQEYNDFRDKNSDSLILSAINFNQIGFYLKNSDKQKTNISLNYTLRNDETPEGEAFKPRSNSQTLEGKISLNQWKDQMIAFTGAFRKLNYKDTQIVTPSTDNQSILGRLEYNGSIFKRLIQPNILYEVGSGQQQKQEYIYVEVPAGQGTYMWIDYNNDGVQQANEFQIAIYPDQMKFIRVITPTNDFVRVNYVILNSSIQVSPENLWSKKTKKTWQKFVSRFSNQLSLQINNKSLATSGFHSFIPLFSGISDANIIANSSSINNSLFFNQTSTKWGLEYNYNYNSGKSLLTYGLEGNEQTRNNAKFRYTIKKWWTINISGLNGIKAYTSALADGRTYRIQVNSIEPGISWIKPSLIRVTTSYKYDYRNNAAIYGNEFAKIQSINLDTRLTTTKLGSIQVKGTFASIQYNGASNSPISFVMLDALQKGTNWLWSLNWQRKISKGIELSIDYEGRKSENATIIHNGRMSIRALL